MENMENNPENKETESASEKQKKESLKIDGISHQLNMGMGSPLHARFALHYNESKLPSPRQFVSQLLDLYEKRGHADEQGRRLAQLEADAADFDAERQQLRQQIAELQDKLDNATSEARESAESCLGKHLQLEEMKEQIKGAIVIKPNPVTAYFLNEMAEKEGADPGKILEKLFIDDLQNPRSNNLPYVVTSARIRSVMNEIKENSNEE